MKTNSNDSVTSYGFGVKEGRIEKKGLTKREQFAAMAMQGMLSNSDMNLDTSYADNIIEDSIYFADRLIEKLNNIDS